MHKKRWNGIIPSLTVGKIKNAKNFLAELFFRDTYKNRYTKKTDCKSVKKRRSEKIYGITFVEKG